LSLPSTRILLPLRKYWFAISAVLLKKVDITFFGRTAEVANQYLRKGSKVLIEGRFVLDQWTAQDGSKRSKHSVTVDSMQMLDSRGDNPAQAGSYGQPAGGGYNQGAPQGAPASQGYNQAPTQADGYGAGAVAQESYGAEPTPKAAQEPIAQHEENLPEIDISEDEIPF